MLENNKEESNTKSFRVEKIGNSLAPALLKSINKIIQSEGYITYSMHNKDIPTKGENYLSSLIEVKIKGKTINNDKETNLFIKQCLPNSDKNLISPQELFLKEIFIYTEFVNVFTELQNEFNVPDEEKYNFVNSYGASNDFSLILKNMTVKGFKTYNRFDVMPLKVMELSIKQLAKFHAFSRVLKEYKLDFYKNKIQTKIHSFIFDDKSDKFLTSVCSITLEILEDERKNKMEQYLSGLSNKLYRYFHENEGYFKCLCHGDYRMNNILVKEIDGEAVTVIPIDYQAIYYGSPIQDLLYIIFSSTDRRFRQNHMEDLKDIYFESFTKFLQYFNIEVNSVYPRKYFENDFEKQQEAGLVISVIVLPFILASEDDIPELNSEYKASKMHESFKSRIEEIVDDFIEWGYL